MYSIIVPVFNRPDEVDELLRSLTAQTFRDFEVVVVEDGSTTPCQEVCERYAERLDLRYFSKPNSGPGQSRNYGAERARGAYLIILDSDVVLPAGYLAAVDDGVRRTEAEAFGGPDKAHPSFSPTQKAISHSMTSFFTTGGIRGGKAKLDKFYPRSFNMGVRADVYRALGGFSRMRFGEDIDFSYRIVEAGYRPRLFAEAWVWHKRRTDFRKFWRQVYNSGIARINLEKRHPGTLKIVHLLPMAFTLGVAFMALLAVVLLAFGPWWGALLAISPVALYSLLVFADSALRYRSPRIGFLSVGAAFVQLTGYGCGFLEAWWKRVVKGQGEFQAYAKNFYK